MMGNYNTTEAGVAGIDRLDWLALRFSAVARLPIAMENPYDDLRGSFGFCLHEWAPLVYIDLFGKRATSADNRPYVICPGRKMLAAIDAGEAFDWQLTLVGAATRHAPACIEAMERLGTHGMTRARHRYRLQCVTVAADGDQVLYEDGRWRHAGGVGPARAAALFEYAAVPGSAVSIELLSPLRLKADQDFVRATPAFATLFERLLGRLQLLAGLDDQAPLLSHEAKSALLKQTLRIVDADSRVGWEVLRRYSGRQRRTMEFGGLTGALRYHGSFEGVWPWLRLGEALHVGSKTTFGLGAYRLSSPIVGHQT